MHFFVHWNIRAEEVQWTDTEGTSIMIWYIILQSYSVIVEPDSFKVTAAANTGQRVSSEALKAWKNPSETLTLFGTWCQTIATSPPYHWHIITIVLTYSYLCILETSLGLITEALGYFGAAGRIYQSGRSKSFHSKYWTGHEVNSFVVEGFGQRASLTLNHYEWWTDLLDDPAGTSKLARKHLLSYF